MASEKGPLFSHRSQNGAGRGRADWSRPRTAVDEPPLRVEQIGRRLTPTAIGRIRVGGRADDFARADPGKLPAVAALVGSFAGLLRVELADKLVEAAGLVQKLLPL